jgi:hypothetical protein
MLNSEIARLAMEGPVPQYQMEKATAASAVRYRDTDEGVQQWSHDES